MKEEKILTEITGCCEHCNFSNRCLEEDCVLWKIEQIVIGKENNIRRGRMKVIDLLNKIANGEEIPKKIKYDSLIWEEELLKDYKNKELGYLFDKYMCFNEETLNNEVEILDKTEEELCK